MIEYWFPTMIYVQDLVNTFDQSFNDYCYRKIIDIKNNHKKVVPWHCNTYSTLDVINLSVDIQISKLIDVCKSHVSVFAKSFGLNCTVECVDCWGNIASPGEFQEKHVHPKSHFSLVYYVKCPENSGNTVFYSPYCDDMFPLPRFENNNNSTLSGVYKPIES